MHDPWCLDLAILHKRSRRHNLNRSVERRDVQLSSCLHVNFVDRGKGRLSNSRARTAAGAEIVRLSIDARSASIFKRLFNEVATSDRSVSSSAPAGIAKNIPATATARWQTEDWIAVLLGFVVIALVVVATQ